MSACVRVCMCACVLTCLLCALVCTPAHVLVRQKRSRPSKAFVQWDVLERRAKGSERIVLEDVSYKDDCACRLAACADIPRVHE